MIPVSRDEASMTSLSEYDSIITYLTGSKGSVNSQSEFERSIVSLSKSKRSMTSVFGSATLMTSVFE